ncbi:DUF1853 family protein [Vibrio sp. CAU 1672]|uniref:DUF1853 family protein n=1 Tax=Vibrio sp. CAU 1672 TaxID=3032594 RepID=UPI0023DC871C|nr:DUF1853 family protein [Vibrio sp. CAU 1672]MDF2155259.1 DUF1853 family protein [Vibrio sp. CAU 1672]
MNQIQRFYHWIASSAPIFKPQGPFVSLQDLVAGPLQDEEGYAGNPRLGFVYQHLCSKLLANSEQYEIVLEEAQLNRENGQTLGAIDLIVNNQWLNQLEHWEVAIKFYLLYQGSWYGPNAHDQLDKKLARMLSHQLKMSTSDEFIRRFPHLNVASEQLLMQGRLYINPFLTEPVPHSCLGYALDPEQITGFWCFRSQWEHIAEPVFKLEKPYWATGLSQYSHPASCPDDEFIHAQTRDGQFWFIVPDDWPNNPGKQSKS